MLSLNKPSWLILPCAIILILSIGVGLVLDSGVADREPEPPESSPWTYWSTEERATLVAGAYLVQPQPESGYRLTLRFADWYTQEIWDVNFFEGGIIYFSNERAADYIPSPMHFYDDDGCRLIPVSYIAGGQKTVIEYSVMADKRQLILELSEFEDYFLVVRIPNRFGAVTLDLREIVDSIKGNERPIEEQLPGIFVRSAPGTEVRLIVHEVTPTGIAFAFDNPTNRGYTYGYPFELFVRRGDAWFWVEPLSGQMFAFWLPGFSLHSRPIERSWERVAGGLPPGEYKFRTGISYWHGRSPVPSDRYEFEVIFTMP